MVVTPCSSAGLGLPIPEQLHIKVGVRVDETGAHDLAGSVDLRHVTAIGDGAAYLTDDALLDAKVTDERGQPRPVNDTTAANDEIHDQSPSEDGSSTYMRWRQSCPASAAMSFTPQRASKRSVAAASKVRWSSAPLPAQGHDQFSLPVVTRRNAGGFDDGCQAQLLAGSGGSVKTTSRAEHDAAGLPREQMKIPAAQRLECSFGRQIRQASDSDGGKILARLRSGESAGALERHWFPSPRSMHPH